jgi:CHAT domain-containing protein
VSILENTNISIDKNKHIGWCQKLSDCYRTIGDYTKEEGYLFKVLSLVDSFNLSNTERIGKIYSDIGRNFINQGDYKLSEYYLNTSKRLLIHNNSKKQASLFRNFAILFHERKDFLKSIEWIKKAINFVVQNKISDNYLLADMYETFGLALTQMGDYSNALNYYYKTLKLRHSIRTDNSSMSNIYENIAGAYGRMDELDSALFYIDLSIIKLHSLEGKDYLKEYKELRNNDFGKRHMIRKLQMRGKFLTAKFHQDNQVGFLIKSEESFSEADSLVYLLRKEIKNKDSKMLLGSTLDTVYSYAINNAYLLWEETGDNKYLKRAYHYTSENKAVIFTETKEELNAVWNILNPDLRDKYLLITEELTSNLYQKQYAALKNDTIGYQRLNNEFITLSSEKEKLIKEISLKYPKFYNYIYGSDNLQNIEYLQSHLDDDNTILEYYINGSNIYIFVISKESFYMVRQDAKLKLDSLFNDFNSELTIFSNSWSVLDKSKIIYPILFPSKVKQLLDDNTTTRLIIIRDKSLNKVTFGPIMTGNDLRKDYLIFKYAISYAFNNKYIWDINQNKEEKDFGYGGFATSYNKTTLSEIAKDIIYWQNSSAPELDELKQSKREVETIAELFHSKYWFDDDATIKNFKESANKSQILHLALHSLIAINNNEQSAMIFQRTKNEKEFILKSADLIGLRLNNSLSVLSACFTSDGDVMSGEGIKSLARSFALAGSPAILAAQWQAYEGQTGKLLFDFHNYLKEGYTKDVALQKTQIDYIKTAPQSYNTPANWAQLMIVGDTSKISFKSSEKNNYFTLKSFLLLAIIFMLLFHVFFRKKIFK